MRSYEYLVAFDADPDNPNPHPWGAYGNPYASEAEARQAAKDIDELNPDAGWLIVRMPRKECEQHGDR